MAVEPSYACPETPPDVHDMVHPHHLAPTFKGVLATPYRIVLFSCRSLVGFCTRLLFLRHSSHFSEGATALLSFSRRKGRPTCREQGRSSVNAVAKACRGCGDMRLRARLSRGGSDLWRFTLVANASPDLLVI